MSFSVGGMEFFDGGFRFGSCDGWVFEEVE